MGGGNEFSCKDFVSSPYDMTQRASPEPDAPPAQLVKTLHLSKMCALKVLESIKGIYCKYCVAANTVSNLVGKGFMGLAGPFVTGFCFLESHKRNCALTKVNSKIPASWGAGEGCSLLATLGKRVGVPPICYICRKFVA